MMGGWGTTAPFSRYKKNKAELLAVLLTALPAMLTFFYTMIARVNYTQIHIPTETERLLHGIYQYILMFGRWGQ